MNATTFELARPSGPTRHARSFGHNHADTACGLVRKLLPEDDIIWEHWAFRGAYVQPDDYLPVFIASFCQECLDALGLEATS